MLKHAAAGAAIVVVVVVNAGCSNRCIEGGRAVSGVAIPQGVAGVGTASADDCALVCSCSASNRLVAVAPVDAVPDDDADAAFALARAEAGAARMVDGKYERAVDAGAYLVCDGDEFADCVFVVVDADAVTTVNFNSGVGGTAFRVFDGDGDEVDAPPTFEVSPDEGE